jgi:hypothetical protein
LALENLTFDEARRALEMATGAQLLAFDQERPAYWHGDLPTRAEILAVLAKESPIRANLDAYLFMESCSGNGYVREEALRALKLNVSRLACAAALIRANDWVPQVNRLAVDMIGVYSRDEPVTSFQCWTSCRRNAAGVVSNPIGRALKPRFWRHDGARSERWRSKIPTLKLVDLPSN